jgi:hypothetical protein
MPLAWVPYADHADAERHLGAIPAGLDLDFYRAGGDALPATIADVAFYVLPYNKGLGVLAKAGEMPRLRVVQTLTAGYDEFLPLLPATATLCNAAGLHDTSTAELAVALALASGRHLDSFARNQGDGAWRPAWGRSIADRNVLIIGYGHIGQAIERRLQGFEVASITRAARRARSGPPQVHPISELHQLLPRADVVFLIVPHTPETEGLIGAAELKLLPAGPHGGDRLAGDQPAFAGELVDDVERRGDALRAVDHDRDGGDVPAQLQQPVAVRRVVAVEAPHAAQGGRAAEPGRAQPPDDRAVDRLAVVQRRLGGVDHELVPQRHAVLVGGGQRVGRGQQPPVPLADADALEGEQRAAAAGRRARADPADPRSPSRPR